MTSDRESIFRHRALEHHRQGRGPGDPVRLSPLWTTWVFWALLGAFAILIAASLLVTVSEDFEGVALVHDDGQTVLALFPTTDSEELEVGDEIALRLPGGGPAPRLPIKSIGPVVEPGSRSGLSPQAASLVAAQARPSLPVYAELPSDYSGLEVGTTGTAVAHLEGRLLFEVVPALKSLFAIDG